MSKSSPKLHFLGSSIRGAALAVSAAALAACVAQVRVAGPPPPAVYVAPAAVEIQANEAPPPLPDYEQPACPEDGYLWAPGYWAWGGGGYYWVPGTWVQPPRVGVLWTPGYWGFVGGAYAFHAGYWGPHVGFYGGVNYGFGYVSTGFAGGVWVGNSFSYNRAVTNINVTVVHNTYNTTVINNVTVNKVSYNGGAGGLAAAPTAQERQFAQEPHAPATALQQQHVQQAAKNPALFARANGGHPAIAATPRPAAFNAPGVVGSRGASAPAANRPPQNQPGNPGPVANQAQIQNHPPVANQNAKLNPAAKPKPGPKQNQKKKDQKKKPAPKKPPEKDEGGH
jgi:WXXGXW repeat (2 copies)